MIVVFSRPGRETITAQTVHALESHGGLHATEAGNRWLFWIGLTPPPRLPIGWQCFALVREPRGSVADFWELLHTFPGEDLSVFEDDVLPCRNAAIYIERWDCATMTTFFNPHGHPVGSRRLSPTTGFVYSQAIKIPRAVAAKLRGADPSKLGVDHDVAIGIALNGEHVFYHRSLVEHVGLRRVDGKPCAPRPRYAPDYVGSEFDALSLMTGDGGSR